MSTRPSRLLAPDKLGPFVAWAALVAFAAWAAHGLGFGSFAKPGPGLFPVLLSVAIGVLAVADLLVKGKDGKAAADGEDAAEIAQLRRQRMLVIGCVILFAVLLPYLGTVLVSLLMMMFLLVVVERQPIGRSLAISLGTSVGMYLILATAFGVPLPNGPLEFLF